MTVSGLCFNFFFSIFIPVSEPTAMDALRRLATCSIWHHTTWSWAEAHNRYDKAPRVPVPLFTLARYIR